MTKDIQVALTRLYRGSWRGELGHLAIIYIDDFWDIFGPSTSQGVVSPFLSCRALEEITSLMCKLTTETRLAAKQGPGGDWILIGFRASTAQIGCV